MGLFSRKNKTKNRQTTAASGSDAAVTSGHVVGSTAGVGPENDRGNTDRDGGNNAGRGDWERTGTADSGAGDGGWSSGTGSADSGGWSSGDSGGAAAMAAEAATADPCREARLTRRCTPPPSADLDEGLQMGLLDKDDKNTTDEEKKRRSDEDDALTLGLVTGMSVGGFGIAG